MYNRDDRSGALTRRPQEGMSRQRGNDWLWQRDPWQEMQEMQRRMDQIFSSAFGQSLPGFSQPMGRMMNQMSEMGVAEPDIDFRENETEYTIQAALPGISPGDIDVQATVDSIRLTAQSRQSSQQQPPQSGSQDGGSQTGSGQGANQQSQGQTMQHRQGQFSRVSRFEFAYSLPEDIKPNEVKANFRHGVLELSLPKANPNTTRNKPVSVPIQGESSNVQITGAASGQQGAQTGSASGASSSNAEHQSGSRSGDGTGSKTSAAQSAQSTASTPANSGTK